MDNLSTSNSGSSNAYVKADQFCSDHRPVAFFNEADNITHFEHHDWVGTERMRTDNVGSTNVATFSSLPFGEPNLSSGSDLDPAHFTGLDQDGAFSASSLGLHHATFREYNSTLGRWMSPDSYSGSYSLGDPQSFNRYSYVRNNPLAMTAPSGLIMQCLTIPGGTVSYGSESSSISDQTDCFDDGSSYDWFLVGYGGNQGTYVYNPPAKTFQPLPGPKNGEPPSGCFAANIAAVNQVSNLNVSMTNVVGYTPTFSTEV